MKRNLDGVYFRMQEPDGSWGNTCFSDMTDKQREEIMKNRDVDWLKSMCQRLANVIREMGDQFDIVMSHDDI